MTTPLNSVTSGDQMYVLFSKVGTTLSMALRRHMFPNI